jgi:hypothetical protein
MDIWRLELEGEILEEGTFKDMRWLGDRLVERAKLTDSYLKVGSAKIEDAVYDGFGAWGLLTTKGEKLALRLVNMSD